jgi:hypothetical protein
MKKHIDIKSLLIGIFLASTVLLAIGATRPTDKWDPNQKWSISSASIPAGPAGQRLWDRAATGAEPFAVQGGNVVFRKRIQ